MLRNEVGSSLDGPLNWPAGGCDTGVEGRPSLRLSMKGDSWVWGYELERGSVEEVGGASGR